jgi:hypothetical protein
MAQLLHYCYLLKEMAKINMGLFRIFSKNLIGTQLSPYNAHRCS